MQSKAKQRRTVGKKDQYTDPILRLYSLGHLKQNHVRVAREIGALVREHDAWQGARSTSFAGSRDHRTPNFKPIHREIIRGAVYAPWAAAAGDDLAIILAAVVEGESLEAIRRKCGLRWDTALKRLRAGLELYGRMRTEFDRRPVLERRSHQPSRG